MSYILPPGAIVIEKAGDRKRREAATRLKQITDGPRRAAMFARNLILNHDKELKARRGYLAAMIAEQVAVVAEIASLRARVLALKDEDLPEAERRVAAARAKLDAFEGDVARAQAIADASAVLSEGSK